MSRYHRPADQARTALLDAAMIAATIDATLAALDLGLGGFPTSTPGAGPSSPPPSEDPNDASVFPTDRNLLGHLPTESSTTVERNATHIDQARADLAILLKSLDAFTPHLARAAGVCHRWAFTGVDASTVKNRLVAIDSEIWCVNCIRHGQHNPRSEGKTECRFCADFRRDYKRPAPKEIWDARDARGGRIDVATINRILANIKAAEKARKTAEKAAAKAERPRSLP